MCREPHRVLVYFSTIADFTVDYGGRHPQIAKPYRKIQESCPEPTETLWQKDI